MLRRKRYLLSVSCPDSWRGDRGVGARENINNGREGYGRRERKGREVEDLRWQEAGEICETLIFFNSTMR